MIFSVLFRNYNDMNYLRFKQILQYRTSHVQDYVKRVIKRGMERDKRLCVKQLPYERIQSIFTQFDELIRDCFN